MLGTDMVSTRAEHGACRLGAVEVAERLLDATSPQPEMLLHGTCWSEGRITFQVIVLVFSSFDE